MGRNNPAETKGKTERQQTILRLIQEHPISRQEVLLEHLRQEGFEVTQATISRDIRELCLVKAATADGYRYVSSHNESLNPKMQGRFETIFRESVLGVDFAGHVVLVKCYSGMANAACEVFDALKWKNVVGTLSGDDTFLIVARSERDAKTICSERPVISGRNKRGSETMLSSLQIENVAVIQKANVHFEKGLNVLTGETGAGKSILIDSINAILGNRTSKDLVRTGAAKAVIRAAFEDVPPAVLDSLEKAGYERSEALLLSREITAEGKSACRINGMPATAAVLRELCGGLININGQHDSVGLLNPARHEGILDAYAQNSAEYQAYYAIYRELVGVKKTLDAMITDESEKQRRIDLLSYQVQEIDDAGLTAGEEQTLESRRKVLANASTIRDRIAQCYALLSGGDEAPGAVDLLGEASNAVDAAAQLDGELSAGAGQLLDLYYTAKDVAADLIGRLDAYDTNDAELDEIEQRIDLIYKLRRKYGDTVEDILAFGERARKELEMIQSSQERVEHLQKEQRRLYTLAREKAEALTQTRLKAFDELNKRISGTLDFLNMPGVRMTLRHSRGPLASHGQDSIEFYISTNPGEAPKPLAKIASGGELSRITLAIKNAMADKDAVPTVIYDEIDSGVSGKAASRIGEVLRQSAEGHQILCITHTAQIAALADCHLLIQKNITNERTYTEIHPLDENGRVEALARLISGDHVTELSLANAREMLGRNAEK